MSWDESLLKAIEEDCRTRLLDRPYAEEEARIAETFHGRLDADDTVHVLGVNSVIYGLLAAEKVGADRVCLFDDDPERRKEAATLLADAEYGDISTQPVADYADHADAATVLVVEETRVGPAAVDSLTPTSLRYLLVKSADRDLAGRLGDAGFETNRLRAFQPLGTPWERIVEAAPTGTTVVPSNRRRWSVANEHRYDDRAETASFRDMVAERIDVSWDSIDSPAALLVRVAYSLYRLPVAVLYAVPAALPDPLIGIVGGILSLGVAVVVFFTVVTSVGVGFRYWLEGAGASEMTVTLSVLGAVMLLILTSPLWLLALVGWFLSKLPSEENA